jgi:hypothetical protein
MEIFQEQIFHCILIRHCVLYEIASKLLHIVVPQTFGIHEINNKHVDSLI